MIERMISSKRKQKNLRLKTLKRSYLGLDIIITLNLEENRVNKLVYYRWRDVEINLNKKNLRNWKMSRRNNLILSIRQVWNELLCERIIVFWGKFDTDPYSASEAGEFPVQWGCSCYCPPIAEWFHITCTLSRSAFVQGQVRWAARVWSCSHFQHTNCRHRCYVRATVCCSKYICAQKTFAGQSLFTPLTPRGCKLLGNTHRWRKQLTMNQPSSLDARRRGVASVV